MEKNVKIRQTHKGPGGKYGSSSDSGLKINLHHTFQIFIFASFLVPLHNLVLLSVGPSESRFIKDLKLKTTASLWKMIIFKNKVKFIK